MTESAEELFDEVIIHISAWRRLRHSVEEVCKSNPEKYGEISEAFLRLMDMCYNTAAMELTNHKESLKHNIEKREKNTKYGRFGE